MIYKYCSLAVILTLVLSLMGCHTNTSPLEIAPVFSDHMVLQQNSTVALWGSAAPNEKIEIEGSWGSRVSTTATAAGQWNAQLETPVYGGPYTLQLASKTKTIQFKDVMIGEVWLASGQSNMEWTMNKRLNNQKEEIAAANYPNIRMFWVPKDLNGEMINKEAWTVASPETIEKFSAVGYFFARKLNQELGIPIGIINSSWGGTRVEAWMSLDLLASLDITQEAVQDLYKAGGYDGLKNKLKRYNDSIRSINQKLLQGAAPLFPEQPNDPSEWESLHLGDETFHHVNYDDTTWSTAEVVLQPDLLPSESSLSLEQFVGENKFASNGVMWFRKRFTVTNPDAEYTLRFEGGIDDGDQTYINGILVGNTWNCCTGRTYTLPEGLLNEGENLLAIRVTDTGGMGGFYGNIFLGENGEESILSQGTWKYRHQAFYIPPYLYEHAFSSSDLQTNGTHLEASLTSGQHLNDPNAYSILFEKMLSPVMPYTIKGALWYQGESNVGNHQEYTALFSSMIKDWRAQWNADFPFYFAQIAPYRYTDAANSQALRDAQRKSLSTPKTGMVVTLDIGEKEDIHPANKQDVGLRFALLALRNDYGKTDLVASGPLYKSHQTLGTTIEILFEETGSGLVGKNNLNGFEVAGADGVFVKANAKITDNKVRVTSPSISNPVHVRYGWSNYFDATLFNQEGLPASSFNTF